jgi:hypothetical protein
LTGSTYCSEAGDVADVARLALLLSVAEAGGPVSLAVL